MEPTGNPSKLNRKKILLISYHFPPSPAVGGLRVAKFAKYLPLFGWNTYVLTIKDDYLEQVDRNRLKEIGSVKIFKASLWPTIMHAYLGLKRIYYGGSKKRTADLEEWENIYGRTNHTPFGSEKIFKRMKRYFISFLMLPDVERNWILPAVLKSIRLIRREKIDCILTSCPPNSVHLIGLLVKMITGVRWVTDFRDPWMTAGYNPKYSSCDLSIKIGFWLEKKVVQRADRILTNTENFCNLLKETYKSFPASKFLCITNGIDSKFFNRFDHLAKYEKFTLTYTGSLYAGRTPEPIFKAMKELVEEGKLDLQNVKVRLIGNCKAVNGYLTTEIAKSYGVDSAVEVLDQVSYSESVQIVKQSHIALLFASNQPFQIPAKVYDYMGIGTRILALSEEGATSDLIHSTGAGIALSPSDIESIKEFIYQSVRDSHSLKQNNYSNILKKYDKISITQNLASHLNSL